MAERTIVQLIDDLDGAELSSGEGEKVRFAVDGVEYEIDLSNENAEAFRSSLQRYIASARVARRGGFTPAKSTSSSSRSSRADVQKIRTWAKENGHKISDRGRIPASVVEAYEASK